MRNVCTIAYWELFQLKWFKLNPFESITNLFCPDIKKHVKKNIYYIVNIIFGIIFYSKYKTVSTICSKTLGPAIFPSFVTCPIIIVVIFLFGLETCSNMIN